MKNPKFSEGKWVSTFSSVKERGVRTGSGYICFLPRPTHYSGQDERYEQELEESKANAILISAAPDLFKALTDLVQLKSHKDHFGKDKHYEINQPIAWANVLQAINKATGL